MAQNRPDPALTRLVLSSFARLNGSGTLERTGAGCDGGERTSCGSGPTAVAHASSNGVRRTATLERYAFEAPPSSLPKDPIRELRLVVSGAGNPRPELTAKFYLWGGNDPVTVEQLRSDYSACARFVTAARTVLGHLSAGEMAHWAMDVNRVTGAEIAERSAEIELSAGIRDPYSSLQLLVPRWPLEPYKPSLVALLDEAQATFETLLRPNP